jgi:hypothetical protein
MLTAEAFAAKANRRLPNQAGITEHDPSSGCGRVCWPAEVVLAAGDGVLEHSAGARGQAKSGGGGPGLDLGAGAGGPVAEQAQVVGVEGGGERDDVQPLGEWATVVQVAAELAEPLAVALFGLRAMLSMAASACCLVPWSAKVSRTIASSTRSTARCRWAVVAIGDKAAGADVVRSMARRASADIEVEGSHVIMISQPQAVTDHIVKAAQAVVASNP